MTEEESKAEAEAEKLKADKATQQKKLDDEKSSENKDGKSHVKVEKEDEKAPVIDLKEDETIKDIRPEKEGQIDEKVIRNALKKGSEITKNQLYPEIKRLKDKINRLADEIIVNADDASQKESDTVVVLKEEKAKIEDKLKVVEDALVDTVKKVESIQDEVTTDKLDSYRNLKIAENKGEIIERLVGGNTKEEIDASIEVAKLEHELVVNSVKKDFNLPEKKEKIEEEKKPKESTVVERIDFSQDATKTWKKDRKDILKKVYEEARDSMSTK